MYDAYEVPGLRLQVGTKNIKHRNWLQVVDNVVDPVHEVFLHARISGLQFTDPLGRPLTALMDIGEFDVVESQVGLMCIEARRVGEDIWSHTVEHICPNIAHIPPQIALPPNYGDGEQEMWHFPQLFRWRMPQDDTDTLEFTFTRVREGEVDKYTETPSFATMAQLAGTDRSYEERQRFPADSNAQVGERPIAVHAKEHLGTTDRGVITFRNLVRDGIQAVKRGEDPQGLFLEEGYVIPTYGNETVPVFYGRPLPKRTPSW